MRVAEQQHTEQIGAKQDERGRVDVPDRDVRAEHGEQGNCNQRNHQCRRRQIRQGGGGVLEVCRAINHIANAQERQVQRERPHHIADGEFGVAAARGCQCRGEIG